MTPFLSSVQCPEGKSKQLVIYNTHTHTHTQDRTPTVWPEDKRKKRQDRLSRSRLKIALDSSLLFFYFSSTCLLNRTYHFSQSVADRHYCQHTTNWQSTIVSFSSRSLLLALYFSLSFEFHVSLSVSRVINCGTSVQWNWVRCSTLHPHLFYSLAP